MDPADYTLILPFDSDHPEFTRGFEAGMLWGRLKHEQGFDGPVHAANAEMVMRIAEALGYSFTGRDAGDGWMNIHLTRQGS